MSTDKNNKTNKILSILKLLILLSIIVAVPLYLLITQRDIIDNLRNLDNFKSLVGYLQRNPAESGLLYIGLQVIQIIISVIPGQIFQIAAGYLYGFPIGLLLSIIGATLGSTIAYILAVVLGRDAIKVFVKPDKMDYWAKRLNSKRAYIIVFLLYLIPGLPKDVIAYVAGISRMDIRAFLILSLIGRTPAMSASILVGAFYDSGNYSAMFIVAGVSLVIFIICLIKRKSISNYLDQLYQKVANNNVNED